MIRFGSVCSGIEAASVAWDPLGFRADWLAEIEKFPSAVLAHHWPDIPNLGDMTKIRDLLDAGTVPAPDVLVGGTPCQAFSVAGLRASLDDDRGQLTLEYVRLLNAIDHNRPVNDECVSVWENVPGVLNTKDNAFGCFLAALAGESDELVPPLGKWSDAGRVSGPQRSIAWRVLDAQYFGVAQRRRRVFVVASARKDFDPCAVLFESEGLRRDTPPSREPVENPPAETARSVDESREPLVVHGTQDPCVSDYAFALGRNNGAENAIVETVTPIHDKATRFAGKTGRGSRNGLGTGTKTDPSFTLTGGDKHAVFVETVGALDTQCGFEKATQQSLNAGHVVTDLHVAGTLTARGMNAVGARDVEEYAVQATVSGVPRKLTPRECERLQGFPDDHTMIPWRNKAAEFCPDGPRYKAAGNSMAVPVMAWIGKRLKAELNQ